MRAALVAIAASAILIAGPASAEDRPPTPAAPVSPPKVTAPPPKPDVPASANIAPADDAPVPILPAGRPGAVGRLIPPEEGAALDDPAAKADPADSQAKEILPAVQGDSPPASEAPPVQPVGPPAHSLLREDDFAFAACRMELTRLGAVYTEEAPVSGEQRDCGIDRPVMVTAILPGVALEGGALMRCDTARALAWWMRDFVQPAARRLPGAPRVTAMTPGSTYQCRGTVGATTNGLSEHSLGNAIDIAGFAFDDGATLPVLATDEGNAAQSFLAAVRWSACMDFATVLGPGSNASHADHLHLDIKQRKGGYHLCE